mgnify:CR=1 FL=1
MNRKILLILTAALAAGLGLALSVAVFKPALPAKSLPVLATAKVIDSPRALPPFKLQSASGPMTAEQLAKAQEEEARKKAEEEAKRQQAAQTGGLTEPGGVTPANPTPGPDTTAGTPTQGGATNPTSTTPPPPPVEKRPDYPVAKKVLGREGFVYSPYNNKIISVRDEQDRLLPSGTLVADPTFDESEKKYFRVP